MMLLCTGISFDSFTLQSVKCHRRNGGKRLQSTEMAGSSGWKWREVVAGGKKGGKVQVRGVSGMKSGGRPTAAFCAASSFVCPKHRDDDNHDDHDDDQSTVSISTTTCDTQSLSILSLVSFNHGASFFTGQWNCILS